MRATGIVRRIDDLGRIVLPKELRRSMGIGDREPLEVYTDRGLIILKRYGQQCVYCCCAEEEKLIEHRGTYHCNLCLAELKAK